MPQQIVTWKNNTLGLTAAQLLDRNALLAVTAPGFIKAPHECEHWFRQVAQATFGDMFDEFFQGNARDTALYFQAHSKLCVPLAEGSQPGDALFKVNGSGGAGHVGDRITGNRVAENSSVHWNGTDARGIRKLTEFGHFDIIVRLALDPRLVWRAPVDQPG